MKKLLLIGIIVFYVYSVIAHTPTTEVKQGSAC